MEVKASVVGRIKIEFNLFKYLRNEPVLITIEDVYVVAGSLNLSEVRKINFFLSFACLLVMMLDFKIFC